MSGLGRERIGGGAINGWYEPHDDARLIHLKLSDWFKHDRAGCQQVMWHAERRRILPPTVTLPRLRAVPVCDRNGDVLIQRSRPHSKARVVAEYCLVNFEGVQQDLAERKERAWRETHAMFLAFLDVMSGFPLTKWKITGRGLTKVGEPLTR